MIREFFILSSINLAGKNCSETFKSYYGINRSPYAVNENCFAAFEGEDGNFRSCDAVIGTSVAVIRNSYAMNEMYDEGVGSCFAVTGMGFAATGNNSDSKFRKFCQKFYGSGYFESPKLKENPNISDLTDLFLFDKSI